MKKGVYGSQMMGARRILCAAGARGDAPEKATATAHHQIEPTAITNSVPQSNVMSNNLGQCQQI